MFANETIIRLLLDCSKLKHVFASSTLQSIGESSFYGMLTLYSIYPSTRFSALGCSSLQELPTLVSVTNIGTSAFQGSHVVFTFSFILSNINTGCSSLSNVILSDTVRSIGDYTFSGCINVLRIYHGSIFIHSHEHFRLHSVARIHCTKLQHCLERHLAFCFFR